MSEQHVARVFYWPVPDGAPFEDGDAWVVGWADRHVGDDAASLATEAEGFGEFDRDGNKLVARPILAREATEVECRINGWDEGTFIRCTERAKRSWPMWQIEIAEVPR